MAEPIPEGRRVNPVIFVAIAAVVLLAALWFFFLRDTGGTAAPTTTRRPAGATTTTRAGGPGATTTTRPGGEVQETFQIFEVKNPFLPLVVEGAAGATAAAPGTAAPTAGTTTGGTTTGGTTGGTTTGGTATGPAAGTETPSTGPGTGTASGGATEPQPQGTRVAMLDAPFTEGGRLVANVRVGSTVYTVGEGDTFATSFRVVSLDANCGVFLFGDNRFTLCAGQEVLK